MNLNEFRKNFVEDERFGTRDHNDPTTSKFKNLDEAQEQALGDSYGRGDIYSNVVFMGPDDQQEPMTPQYMEMEQLMQHYGQIQQQLAKNPERTDLQDRLNYLDRLIKEKSQGKPNRPPTPIPY